MPKNDRLNINMKSNTLFHHIQKSFCSNTLVVSLFRVPFTMLNYSGITPRRFIFLDFTLGTCRSLTSDVINGVLCKIMEKNRNEDYLNNISIDFSTRYLSNILAKLLIPCHRSFYRIVIEPAILASISTGLILFSEPEELLKFIFISLSQYENTNNVIEMIRNFPDPDINEYINQIYEEVQPLMNQNRGNQNDAENQQNNE